MKYYLLVPENLDIYTVLTCLRSENTDTNIVLGSIQKFINETGCITINTDFYDDAYIFNYYIEIKKKFGNSRFEIVKCLSEKLVI